MTRHVAWAADEFLLEQGFTIVDPGEGCRRTATRRGLSFDLEPRCGCDYCPAPDHPNYRVAVGGRHERCTRAGRTTRHHKVSTNERKRST